MGAQFIPRRAAQIINTPAGSVTSTNVQAAINELDVKKQATLGFTPENVVNKDASGGYVGLSLLRINFRNALNTITSFFTNSNTASRTYTFQDRDGTIADHTDLASRAGLTIDNRFTGHQTFQGRVNSATSVGGTVDAITAVYTPSFTVWVDRMGGTFRALGANTTTAPTFAPDGLPAKIIVKENLVALSVGDIAGAGHEVMWIFNATADRVILLNPRVVAGAGGGIGGSGTLNRVARFTATNTIGDSQIFDTGTNIGIGTTTPPARLTIYGDAYNDAGQMIRLGFSPAIDYSIWRSVVTGHLNFDGTQEGLIGYRFNSGNVGIGVGAGVGLAARLHVLGVDSLNTSFAGNISGAAGTGLVVTNANNVGIGTTTPTATLHLRAGTATANTAPLKFTSGPLNTTPEPGAIEFLTDAFHGTITTGRLRRTFAFLESPTFTGTVTIPTPFTLGAVSVAATGTELNRVAGVTSPIQTQIDARATTASPTFTGNVTILGDHEALRVRGAVTGPAWSGRIIAGGPNVAFLMGEYNAMAWLGAHNAALTAWSDFYINPDGAARLFLGGAVIAGGVTPIVTVNNATRRVGIGTVEPGSKLSVSGNAVIGLGYAGFVGPVDGLAIQGNVSIGTIVPETRFHVAGTIRGLGGVQIFALPTPGTPTVTPQGTTGTATWGYRITARSSVGETLASIEGRATTGNATLSTTNFNRITWTAVAGAVDYRVYRTTAGGTPSTTGLIGTTTLLDLNDTGLAASEAVPTIDTSGGVGIGMTPAHQLQLSTDSAGKPATNTWTIVSDKRLKKSIEPANLDLCYNAVKTIPLSFYRWKDDVYSVEQVRDRGSLGWIADDVEKVYPKAVKTIPFELLTEITDGVETIEEPICEEVERTETYVEIIDGQPVQKTRTVTDKVQKTELKEVLDENGKKVLNVEGKPIMHAVPVMQTITRPKTRKEKIEDCKSVNNDQVYAALYGAVQKLIEKVEALERRIG